MLFKLKSLEKIFGGPLKQVPWLNYRVHPVQTSSFPMIGGVLKHAMEPYLTGFLGRSCFWIERG
jgi:hypothetical protein